MTVEELGEAHMVEELGEAHMVEELMIEECLLEELMPGEHMLGELGEATEPLLARAITFITTGNRGSSVKKGIESKEFTNSKRETQAGSNMYFDKELLSKELF